MRCAAFAKAHIVPPYQNGASPREDLQQDPQAKVDEEDSHVGSAPISDPANEPSRTKSGQILFQVRKRNVRRSPSESLVQIPAVMDMAASEGCLMFWGFLSNMYGVRLVVGAFLLP